MKRLRELGLGIGDLEAGERNAISDVSGVSVGHVTVSRDEPDPPVGRGIARTGVTAIVPRPLETLVSRPITAGTAGLEGARGVTRSISNSRGGWFWNPAYPTPAEGGWRLLHRGPSGGGRRRPAG